MTQKLISFVERLPVGEVTKRALVETLVDAAHERRGAVVATLRVFAATFAAWAVGSSPFRFIGNDARASLRRLRRSPAYAIFTVATLAVVIGSTTAVYSVVDAALYRQQPIPHLERVMNIYQSDMRNGASSPMISLSPHDLADLEANQTTFSTIAAWSRFMGTLVTNGASESLLGESVSGTYFSLLGVNAALGRVLQPADDASSAPAVIVLSDGLWRRVFGADPSVIGRTVRIQGHPFQVVGVAPKWFRGSDMPNLLPTPAWIPLQAAMALDASRRPGDYDPNRRRLMLKARLRDGVTLEQARAEVTSLSQRIVAADPERRSSRDPNPASGKVAYGWFVLPMQDLRLHESVHAVAGPMATALMTAVVLVLLVGCSNLANLALARGAWRRQEIAVRIALGASRGRIMREQMVESAIVASAGWALGLLVALGLIGFFSRSVEMHAAVTLTLQLLPSLNLPVLLVSLVATSVVIIAVGLGPAIRQTRNSVRDAIAADGTAVAPRWRIRGMLVSGQVATCVLLLAMSTLCMRELRATIAHDPGFALDRLAVMQLDFSSNKYEKARVLQELDAVSAATRREPGVRSVAVMSALPIGGRMTSASVSTPDAASSSSRQSLGSARWMAVSGPVFETLGVQFLEGRTLTAADEADAPAVAVVSKSLADALYEHGAVGRVLSMKRSYPQPDQPRREATIVGVVADTDTDVFGGSGRRAYAVYVPLTQHDETNLSVVAQTSASPRQLNGPMREAMRGVDREVAIITADTGLAIAGPAVMLLQVTGGIAGALGGFAMLLAITGLYGVLADVVARRTREIGIRVALGAARNAIHRMVLVDGLTPVGIGVAIGSVFAYLAFTALPAFVFLRQLRTGGITSLALAAAPLVVAAVVACYLPARRASRVDPNIALRDL